MNHIFVITLLALLLTQQQSQGSNRLYKRIVGICSHLLGGTQPPSVPNVDVRSKDLGPEDNTFLWRQIDRQTFPAYYPGQNRPIDEFRRDMDSLQNSYYHRITLLEQKHSYNSGQVYTLDVTSYDKSRPLESFYGSFIIGLGISNSREGNVVYERFGGIMVEHKSDESGRRRSLVLEREKQRVEVPYDDAIEIYAFTSRR